MSVTDAENVSCDTVPSAAEFEVLHMFLQLLFVLAVLLDEHHDRLADQAPKSSVVKLVDLRCRLAVSYDLQHADLVLRRHHVVRLHPSKERRAIRLDDQPNCKAKVGGMRTVDLESYRAISYP